jgi:hypothetical protein
MKRFGRIAAIVLGVVAVGASATVAISAAAMFASGGAAAGGRQSPVPSPRATSPTARANRRAARRDAASLITKLTVPAGATPVSAEPAHDHGYLKPQGLLESEFASATAHAWWTVPGSPQSVLDAIIADPPAGATQDGSGSVGDSKPRTSALVLDYAWPPVAGVLGARLLELTVTRIGVDRTGLLAESQSVWIVPRPASERIPARTRVIQIVSDAPGAAHGGDVTLSRRGQVGSVVALLNQLPIEQPGVINCPAMIDPRTITMTFRARPSGPALAVLRFAAYRPWKLAGSNECAPVELSIEGHSRPALDGGNFIQRIERIIGLSIT